MALYMGLAGASNQKFSATGGTVYDTADGYRHHIFYSSETFTVLSGQLLSASVIMQDGGGGGLTATASGSGTAAAYGYGGYGGSSRVSYGKIDLVGISSIAVTVGAGGSANSPGGNSSLSGVSVYDLSSHTAGSGVRGEYYYYNWSDYSILVNPGAGQDGILHSSKNSTWTSSVVSLKTRSGGGGGGGGYLTPPGGGAGGSLGGALGGQNAGSGYNATYQTGGGGGGGGVRGSYSGAWYIYRGSGGSGASGYVVISYPKPA